MHHLMLNTHYRNKFTDNYWHSSSDFDAIQEVATPHSAPAWRYNRHSARAPPCALGRINAYDYVVGEISSIARGPGLSRSSFPCRKSGNKLQGHGLIFISLHLFLFPAELFSARPCVMIRQKL